MGERLPLHSDSVLRITTHSPVPAANSRFGRPLGIGAVLLAVAIVCVAWVSTRENDSGHAQDKGSTAASVASY
jgi:hypothetical protein